MKFGKYLRERIEIFPVEWREHCIDYRSLKLYIKANITPNTLNLDLSQTIWKPRDKSKDDEKDKGEPADKKKKGKDSEKDKGETAGIKKKGKDGENDKIESTSKDDKKNKTESNSRDGGNDDLENEAAYTQADNASTTDDPTAQEVHDNIEDQKNKETKADKKNRDTRNKEEGDLYVEVEGESPRILGMRNGFQFDVVGRFKVKNRSCQLTTIRDFAFLNLVYNTITSTNLKEKISEYQDLLNRFERFTLHASQIEFIESNLLKTKPKEYEKRIFLCLVLGRYLDWRQQESLGRLKLPKNRFPLAQIIDTLENFQPDTFPEEYYLFLSITMTAVIQLNVDNRSFDWLKLFEIASIIDPSFTFIEAIQDLRYNNIDDLVKNFLKEFIKHAKPVVNQIKDLKIYSNIGRWLFSNCNSFETLLFVWTDVIDHTKDRDIHLLRHFRPRVEQLVSLPRATLLAKQFSLIPAELCVEVAVIFKVKALLLLKNRSIEWDKKNSEAILQILKDSQLNWSKEEFLEAMDYVSESSKHYLLVTFPSLLSYWFDSKFKTLITNKLPEICRNWYYHLIERINGSDLRDSNDSKFIYAIYKNLSDIFPIVGKYAKIFNDMLEVTVNHVRNCAVSDILSVTPNIATLEKEISVSYGGMVKAMLWKSVHKIDNNLIKILLQVCGCDNEILDIPSALSEDIVCSVMTNLEAKDDIVALKSYIHTLTLSKFKDTFMILPR
ncbi:10560_t:CDS:2 [Funneliformis geosporum]|nr:10560_t:CDS:2 [Funneliformis geosporum]